MEGGSNAEKIVLHYEKIFGYTSPNEDEQNKALEEYNKIVSHNDKLYAYYQIGSQKKVATIYYEFSQFKRGYFDCTNSKYNPTTGRIVGLTFTFTGKFQ